MWRSLYVFHFSFYLSLKQNTTRKVNGVGIHRELEFSLAQLNRINAVVFSVEE